MATPEFWQTDLLVNQLLENDIACPYCGETITILIDASIDTQQYIEDCQVCCRPIDVHVTVASDGQVQVEARDENA